MVCGHTRGRVRSFSYQSLMPACACTPSDENSELRFYAANSHVGFCHTTPRPQRGTSPRATFPLPAHLDSGLRRNDEKGRIDECGSDDMPALSGSSNTIFVPNDESGKRYDWDPLFPCKSRRGRDAIGQSA